MIVKSIQELFRLLKVKPAPSTAHHPQTDGTTERFNQEIEAYLSIYCATFPNDWAKALPILEFVHNNRRHAGRQQTPFKLVMGLNPLDIPLVFEKTKFPLIEERLEAMNRYRNEAQAAHELARNRMQAKITSSFTPFKPGQRVWLENHHLKTRRNKKISPKREEPLRIREVLGPLTYKLDLLKTWRIHHFPCLTSNALL